jgi:hypothetical protein
VSFCHHLASVVRRPLTFHILIFSAKWSETLHAKFRFNLQSGLRGEL